MDKKIIAAPEQGSVQEFPWGKITWLHGAPYSGSEELTFGEVIINPGQANGFHGHPNCEEVLYLISGTLEHTYGEDKSFSLRPGDSICIPRGIKHNARCTSDEPARMVVAFSSAHREVENE